MKDVSDGMLEFCKLISTEFPEIIIFLDKNNFETMITKDLIQDDDIVDESHIQMNQKDVEVLSIILTDEHHEEKIDVEKEPVHELVNDEQDTDQFNFNNKSMS